MSAGTFNVPPRRGKLPRRSRQFRISSARSYPLNNEIDPAGKGSTPSRPRCVDRSHSVKDGCVDMSMCVIVVPEFTAKPASPLAADVWVPAKPQHPRLKIVQTTNHKFQISDSRLPPAYPYKEHGPVFQPARLPVVL